MEKIMGNNSGEKYIVIQEFMVDKLCLKGNDLIVYAIIYGFSQDGKSVFTGTRQYLSKWTGAGNSGIDKNLTNLVEKGLIEKIVLDIDGIKKNNYKAIIPYTIKI